MECPFFFFNDTATTEIYTLSLHDALPIYRQDPGEEIAEERALDLARVADVVFLKLVRELGVDARRHEGALAVLRLPRSEEHTSELQSRQYLVCRLLLEKKKKSTACTNTIS